jgi:deoxycytidylate deaminase
MSINDKFVGKYMRLAKQVGEDKNPCHSRKIGVVVVDPVANKILGTGYNGPPKGTPHTTAREYLKEVFLPQLTPEESLKAYNHAGIVMDDYTIDYSEKFCDQYENCEICPRKIIGAASGQRLELCSCVHAETNAIVNCADDLNDAWMFCWCGVPCIDCTKLIINAGIKKVFVIDWGADYSFASRWLFDKANVEIVSHVPEYYLGL